MKFTKLILLTLGLLILATPAIAEPKGWGAGLAVHDGDFGFQFRKDFHLGGDVSQITGQAGLLFPSKTVVFLDVDYHWVIKTESGTSRFYPLVGLDFKFNSDHAKFGLNLGGGANFMLTDSMAAFAEIKYVVSDWDGLGWGIGIYF